jgi:hypothetical protein
MARSCVRPKKPELLGGPYHPPALRRGDRTTCLFRDAEVVITRWTDAPLSWPRCQRVGVRGGSGLLVTEELVRAIRTESSLAIQYWFGVNRETVWRWRQAFGVTRWGTEGSQRLHQQSVDAGGRKLRGKKRPRSAVQKQMETRRQRTGWKQWELDLLVTASDAEVAAQIGRSRSAVRKMRWRLSRQGPTFGWL